MHTTVAGSVFMYVCMYVDGLIVDNQESGTLDFLKDETWLLKMDA